MSASRAPARTACAAPGCSPTSPPTSRRSPPARPARARRNCCASPTRTWPRSRRRRSPPRSWHGSRRIPERRLEADLAAAQCWACCRHDPLYPVGLRDAADAPWALIGRGDPALLEGLEPDGAVTVVGARRASSYGREIARELGRELAAAGIVVVSGLAFGIDACAHRGALDARPHGRRARLRRRHRLSRGAPLALAADLRAGPGRLRAAARSRRLALDLPRPQPDHGGAGRDDRRGRGGGALGLADHRRPRRRPRPGPRRRARARSARAPRPGPTTCSPAAPAWSATPRTSSTRCSAPASRRVERAGPSLDPELLGVLAAVERGGGHLRRGRRPTSTSPAPRPPRPSPAWSCSATSPARWWACTRAPCSPTPAEPLSAHLGCALGCRA